MSDYYWAEGVRNTPNKDGIGMKRQVESAVCRLFRGMGHA
uniref:Uncharacterized protein n=1 Tax=Anguilla anguilla TaxID=7936 RepID=A0A0E9PWS5_ANGAN